MHVFSFQELFPAFRCIFLFLGGEAAAQKEKGCRCNRGYKTDILRKWQSEICDTLPSEAQQKYQNKIMAWNPEVYDQFKKERSQPFYDLVALTEKKPGLSILDLGCGTGELTATLQQSFQNAQILGIDSSAEMLRKTANLENSGLKFMQRNIEEQLQQEETFDLIISNAAIQWCGNHDELFPKIIRKINSGGQLAVQIPSNHHFIVHRLLRKIAETEPFQSAYRGWQRAYTVLTMEEYAKILFDNKGTRINVFEKVYPHVMENAEAIFSWASGTAMLPYIEKLPEDLQSEFKEKYLEALKDIYPQSPVFYPFKRTFIYAQFQNNQS